MFVPHPSCSQVPRLPGQAGGAQSYGNNHTRPRGGADGQIYFDPIRGRVRKQTSELA
jgi:hypothetical protein